MKIRIGCSGWSYDGWIGPFYPKGSNSSNFLKLYSKVFDTVEIDSTYYRVPNRNSVMNWERTTPANFLFSPKFPGEITHKNGLNVSSNMVSEFLEPMNILGKKLGPILIQLPAFITYQSSLNVLMDFMRHLPPEVRFAIEFRHESWFRQEIYNLLETYNISMVWSDIPMAKVPAIRTTDFVYLRLVGDRSIESKDFGVVKIDRNESILRWAKEINQVKDDIKNVFVFANNHYQGFSPATVNIFRKAMNMEPVSWSSNVQSNVSENQRRLF